MINPELEKSIRERITLGHTREQITAEMQQAGYDDETIEQIYQAVAATVPTVDTTATPASQSDSDSGMMSEMRNGMPMSNTNDEDNTIVPAPTEAEKSMSMSGDLIGYKELIRQSFQLVLEEWRLFAVALGYYVVISVGALIVGILSFPWLPETLVVITFFVGFLVVTILILSLAISVQRQLLDRHTHPGQCKLKLRESLPHVWGPLVVSSIYANLVIYAGYFFLIIPGIALTFYLYFAGLVRITDTARGMDALVTSISMVYGRWWSVFGRLILSSLVFASLSIPVFLIMTFAVFILMGDNIFFALNVLLLAGALVVYYEIFFLFTAQKVLLFESLRDTHNPKLPADKRKNLKFILWVLLVIGILVYIFSIAFQSDSLDDAGYLEDSDWSADNQELSPTEQAEIEEFLLEYGADLELEDLR